MMCRRQMFLPQCSFKALVQLKSAETTFGFQMWLQDFMNEPLIMLLFQSAQICLIGRLCAALHSVVTVKKIYIYDNI